MEMYKFIAWADIHWDEFGAKCITIEDTDKLERAIFQRAREGGFDFTVFIGDRYQKREPHDEVKVKADRVIEDLVHNGNIPHFHLIGNHDWVDATMKWHTAESIKRFNNCHVLDKSATSTFKNVRIHALPADFKMDISNYQIDSNCFNLFLFHDMLRGSFLNEDQTYASEGGLDPALVDLPVFDLVLAGDIHIRQKFKFDNTRGGYLGSAIQRTKADSNIERGWTEYTISRTAPGQSWKVEEHFQPIRNFFTRVSFNVDSETIAEELIIPVDQINDQLVEVRLVGDRGDVDRVSESDYWNKLKREYNARRVDLLACYSAQSYESPCEIGKEGSVLDDINTYLDSDFSSVGNISKGSIIEKVNELRGLKHEASCI